MFSFSAFRPGPLTGAVAFVAFAALVTLPGPAALAGKGGKPSFGGDIVLPGGQGGEPSFAIDTSATAGRGDEYVVAIGDSNGPLEWHSANIFGTLAIDSAGNYYALFGGTADDRDPAANPYHVYLETSTDHGQRWSRPIQVDRDANGAGTHVFAHLAVTAAGNVDVVWYGTTATGEPNGVCGTIATQSPCKDGFPPYSDPAAPAWNIYLAQSTNALSATPTFTQVAANPKATHYGEVCTNGLVCGSSDRSLLDFISLAVDCNRYAHIAYGGNTKVQEAAGETFVHVANQTGGSALAPPATC
jgi:hypothetical protein